MDFNNMKSPKLDRDFLRDISNRKLKLSKTAISAIFQLTPFIDRDGRIHLDKRLVRTNLFCDRRTLENVLCELLQTEYKGKKLITFENGYYVSHFHKATNGNESYLKHLPFYHSFEFLNLTLNQARLFLYIATLNIYNQWKSVAVENLYKNSLHDKKYGMHVYDDYKSMANDLFFLIDQGFISVRFPNKEEINKTDLTYKKRFHEMCGYNVEGERKSRTSKYRKENHVIGLKINDDVFGKKKNIVNSIASETELRLLAERFHMYLGDMKTETVKYFIGKKNDLMEQFGLAGLQVYRSSLEKYFEEKNANIIYYDHLEKAVNYFTDFYLFEEIKKVILAAIKYELGNVGALSATGYSFAKTHFPLLVEYFVANASDEHIVLINQDIQTIENADELMSDLCSAEEPWISLHRSIETVFVEHFPKVRKILEKECDEIGVDPIEMFSKIKPRELVVSLAKKSLLSQQKKLDSEAKKLNQIIRFFRKKEIPRIVLHRETDFKNEEAPRLWNWLKS